MQMKNWGQTTLCVAYTEKYDMVEIPDRIIEEKTWIVHLYSSAVML
jgi:hypothetical protein